MTHLAQTAQTSSELIARLLINTTTAAHTKNYVVSRVVSHLGGEYQEVILFAKGENETYTMLAYLVELYYGDHHRQVIVYTRESAEYHASAWYEHTIRMLSYGAQAHQDYKGE